MTPTRIRKIITSIKGTAHFQQAFTHTSHCNEVNNLKDPPPILLQSYETLEFLGDSILNFYTSLFIYHTFPDFAEGQMSKLKQLMVQESTLAQLSREIGLNQYLQLGAGEKKNQGRDKNSILADIFESFTAALYLEKGGKTVYNFLSLTLFAWVKVSDEGGTFQERGEGKSKKEAEQRAAEKVVKKLNISINRVLASAMYYPEEYGFIPETLDYDGDPLDVVCLANYPTFPSCHLPIRIIGVLKMIDGNEEDDKILAVNAVDPRLNNIQELKDISSEKLNEISNFFFRYKELEKKKVEIKGFFGKEEAEKVLEKCQALYKNYRDLLEKGIDKKELVSVLNKER
ncbi:3067_t:CDS:2 [Ambispora gerdemannii]|uniref:3067_t:CDS:1 n=1 Tax=Ambispora gerdemannii TaxID=144530 RepID=A0A9N9DH01_9GLOM|nr:3067_t:CDS:2 [Ambispora gerdemannii]